MAPHPHRLTPNLPQPSAVVPDHKGEPSGPREPVAQS